MITLSVQIVGLLIWDAVIQQIRSFQSLYRQRRQPGVWPAQYKFRNDVDSSNILSGPNILHSSSQPPKVTMEKTGPHRFHWKDPGENAIDRSLSNSPGQSAKQRYRLPEGNENLYRTTSWKIQDKYTTPVHEGYAEADLEKIDELDRRDPLDIDLSQSLKTVDSSISNIHKVPTKLRQSARTGTTDTSGSLQSRSTTRAGETMESFTDQEENASQDGLRKMSRRESRMERSHEQTKGAIMGHIAVAMAQAGSVLAATTGGAIGKRILVQRVENQGDMLHNILSGGVARMTTRDEEALERDRNAYVAGTASNYEKNDADVKKRRKNSTFRRNSDWQDSERRASASSKTATRWQSISTMQE